jgi:hypothetical protein
MFMHRSQQLGRPEAHIPSLRAIAALGYPRPRSGDDSIAPSVIFETYLQVMVTGQRERNVKVRIKLEWIL